LLGLSLALAINRAEIAAALNEPLAALGARLPPVLGEPFTLAPLGGSSVFSYANLLNGAAFVAATPIKY
jgi:hypothetical protein